MIKTKIKNISLINLRSFSDVRGSLSVAEIKKELPFAVKRVFFIHNVKKSAERACHASKVQREVLFCLNGSFKVDIDDGFNKQTIVLAGPARGLYFGKNLWGRLYDFSKDCIILALCDTEYIANDHITDYKEFLKIARKKNKQ